MYSSNLEELGEVPQAEEVVELVSRGEEMVNHSVM